MINKQQADNLLSLVQALRAADETLEDCYTLQWGNDALLAAQRAQDRAYNAWLMAVQELTEGE